MANNKEWKSLSKMEFTNNYGVDGMEEIRTGAFQRMAEAFEKIAMGLGPTITAFNKMKADNARLEAKVRSQDYVIKCQDKRIAGLKGAITKLKNKIPIYVHGK